MASAVPLVISLLKAAEPIAAIVSDRIEPELANGSELPRIVVRQANGRHVYGLARSARLREARVTVLCAARTYPAADALAETMIETLKDVRHAKIGNDRITLFQDGDDTGSTDERGEAYTRIVGFRVIISG